MKSFLFKCMVFCARRKNEMLLAAWLMLSFTLPYLLMYHVFNHELTSTTCAPDGLTCVQHFQFMTPGDRLSWFLPCFVGMAVFGMYFYVCYLAGRYSRQIGAALKKVKDAAHA